MPIVNIRGGPFCGYARYDRDRKRRKTIEELGGTMPEDLPVADSIKHLESKEQRLLKDKKEERGE